MKNNLNIAYAGLSACCLILVAAYLCAPNTVDAERVAMSAAMAVGWIGAIAIMSLLLSSLDRFKPIPATDETVSVLEAWEAIGHDVGVNPSKEELLESLRYMAQMAELAEGVNPAWKAVIHERMRQVCAEWYDPDHDDEHCDGELLSACIAYAVEAACARDGAAHDSRIVPMDWPWPPEFWKPGTPRRMLEKSLALGLAELERLIRTEERAASQPGAVHP